jgi:DNA gyrase/topoisomerase IV subunit A
MPQQTIARLPFMPDAAFADRRHGVDGAAARREHHTDTKVSFTVTLTDAGIDAAQSKGLVPLLKLSCKMATSNMMLFNAAGVITKYESPVDILRAFYDVRIDFYGRRRAHLLQRAQDALLRISNKVGDFALCAAHVVAPQRDMQP